MTKWNEPERWYAVGCGNEWRLAAYGGIKVVVWLDNDEKTYMAGVRDPNCRWCNAGKFNDIKIAKAFCLEEISKLSSEVIDDKVA